MEKTFVWFLRFVSTPRTVWWRWVSRNPAKAATVITASIFVVGLVVGVALRHRQ